MQLLNWIMFTLQYYSRPDDIHQKLDAQSSPCAGSVCCHSQRNEFQ